MSGNGAGATSPTANRGGLLKAGRRFVTPKPDETVEELARRALPDEDVGAAVDRIRSWNLHIFAMRKPRGLLLGSDVVFVEPPPAR
jgi:hypothetical protein